MKIVFKNNEATKINYFYTATGAKILKIVTNSFGVTRTDYLRGFQYQNNVLQFFPTAEGYVKSAGTVFQYVFNYTDHLGNVRVSYSDLDGNGSVGLELFRICQTAEQPSPTTPQQPIYPFPDPQNPVPQYPTPEDPSPEDPIHVIEPPPPIQPMEHDLEPAIRIVLQMLNIVNSLKAGQMFPTPHPNTVFLF